MKKRHLTKSEPVRRLLFRVSCGCAVDEDVDDTGFALTYCRYHSSVDKMLGALDDIDAEANRIADPAVREKIQGLCRAALVWAIGDEA